MDHATFQQRALEVWQSIPDGFKEGVTAFVVSREAFAKQEFEEGWCYGWCEADPLFELLPDAPVHSRITIFHGSFVEIARLHAEEGEPFDWDAELVETIRHELQHHLEWRAGEDGLGDEDDLQDDNERRLTGLPFTPGFHRWGTPLGDQAWLGDGTLFVEHAVRKRDWARLATQPVELAWRGLILRADAPIPADLLAHGEPLYVPAHVGEGPISATWPWTDIALVVWRKRGWFGG